MGRRRTQVERAYNPHEPPVVPHTGPDIHAIVYGSDRQGSWSPPAPHGSVRATIGEDPHAVLNRPDPRPLSISEQIDLMIARNRGQS